MSNKALFILPIIFVGLCLGHVGSARELTDLSLEITTSKKGNEAKQDAFDRATEEATHRLTEELIGPTMTAKVWASLKPKLLKNTTRYVQFIKGSAPVEVGNQAKIQVQMRVSTDNLEALLREFGALGSNTVRLLPLFSVSDAKSRYVWWADGREGAKETTLSQDALKKFVQQTAARFKGKNVYVLDPTVASFRMGVPSAYRTEALRREDQMLLAQYLKADVVLSGRVEMGKAEANGASINYELELWQARSGRGLTEIQRSEPAPGEQPKVMLAALEQANEKVIDEFGARLQEAISAGSLNLNVVRVAVEGPLDYKQQVEFKKQLATVREIKLLRERLFEGARVTFEAETNTSGTELAKVLGKARFTDFRVNVESSQDDGLVLNVRPHSSP